MIFYLGTLWTSDAGDKFELETRRGHVIYWDECPYMSLEIFETTTRQVERGELCPLEGTRLRPIELRLRQVAIIDALAAPALQTKASGVVARSLEAGGFLKG